MIEQKKIEEIAYHYGPENRLMKLSRKCFELAYEAKWCSIKREVSPRLAEIIAEVLLLAYGVIPSDKTLWWQMIQLLPSSFNQMRTIDLNYETLLSIYRQRKGHKLDEWREFCKWIETLPYMKEFLGFDEQVEKEKRELL